MDPRVAEALWKAMQGHLPPRPPDMHPLGCHRLRIPDRDCFQGILVRLVTGCSWDVAARLCKASETTLRARRTEWLAAGVFDKLVEEAIDGYDRIIGLDLSEVAVDGSLHKAPCGGEGTGPNPTDRAKIGWKWSVATDLFADPHRLGHRRRQPQRLHPARTHPASRRLLLDIETCHLDRGYDSNLTTERCQALGLTDRTLCTLCGLPSSSPPYYRVLISRSWRPAASCGATEP
jgi:transposase